jgi:hypothetical protein
MTDHDRSFEMAREDEDMAKLIQEGKLIIADENIDLAKIKRNKDFFHPPFPEAEQKNFQRFSKTFAEVYPLTAKEWEDGFRCDMHPYTEIAMWASIEEAWLHFIKGKDTEQRKHIWEMLMAWANSQPKEFLKKPPRTLSSKRVREIFELVSENWAQRKHGTDLRTVKAKEARPEVIEAVRNDLEAGKSKEEVQQALVGLHKAWQEQRYPKEIWTQVVNHLRAEFPDLFLIEDGQHRQGSE